MGFIKGVLINLSSQIISVFFQILTGIITANYLGIEGRGIYSLFFSNGAIAASLIYFGMTQALIYDINKREVDNGILIGNSILFILIQSVLFSSVMILLPNSIVGRIVGSSSADILFSFVIFVIILINDMILSGLLLGSHKYQIYASYTLLQNTAVFIACAPSLVFTMSSSAAIISRLALHGMLVIFLWIIALNKLEYSKIKISIEPLMQSLAFGSKNYFQNIIGMVNSRIALTFIGLFSTISEVSFYSISLMFISSIRLVPDAIGTVLLPKLTTIEGDEHDRLTKLVLKIIIYFSIFLCILLLPLIKPIIQFLFSNEYQHAILPTQIMLVGSLFGAYYQILTRAFTSHSNQVYSILAAGIGCFISSAISLLLIPKLGALGGAISFSFAHIITACLMIIFYCSLRKLPISELMFLTRDEFKWIYVNLRNLILSCNAR